MEGIFRVRLHQAQAQHTKQMEKVQQEFNELQKKYQELLRLAQPEEELESDEEFNADDCLVSDEEAEEKEKGN